MRLQHTKLAAANLSTDSPDRLMAKAVIVAEVERLHWRIWNGKAKNAQRSINRIRKVMHVFKGESSQRAKGVASRKLWHALHAVDKYLRGQAAWLVNYANRFRAGLRVGTSITEGTANFLQLVAGFDGSRRGRYSGIEMMGERSQIRRTS
jgi:hypothetical protein